MPSGMSPPQDCYSLHSFAGLPEPPYNDQLDIQPEHIRVHEWSFNPHQQGLRLTLAHRGALFAFRLYGDDAYGRSIMDAVVCSWMDDIEGDGWYDEPYRSMMQRPPAMLRSEAQLLDVAVSALPRLIVDAERKSQASISGARLLIDIKTDANTSQPKATLIGDMFRDILRDELITLDDNAFPNIPRFGPDCIIAYSRRLNGTNAFYVNGRIPDGKGRLQETRAFFKTLALPRFLQEAEDPLPSQVCYARRMFIGEVSNMASTPPHPNVIPAPQALITISGADQRGKLVGFVQSAYSAVRGSYRDDDSLASAQAYLRFARDLCHGVQHLAESGFMHPDLSCDNLLVTLPSDGNEVPERLLVGDLEPIPYYSNKDGPAAPEALGQCLVHLHKDGTLAYELCKQDPRPCLESIYTELARVPEARERLLVYSVGCTLSQLLDLRLSFPEADLSGLRHDESLLCLRSAAVPGQDPVRDAWEAHFPAAVRDVAQRCVACDPRERPLLNELSATMDRYVPL
ncbi:hypothetical protein OC835_007174 [Tilletia horrida]|nr:hypothetical protein OC835_007174 [Tilletia horrida]